MRLLGRHLPAAHPAEDLDRTVPLVVTAVGLRSDVRVGPDLPYLLCAPAGNGEPGSPLQRVLA